MPFPLLVKAAALGAAALTGAGGIAWSLTASGPDGSPAVWVDGPHDGASVVPGLVAVTAHASAKDAVSRLVLLVDGKEVGTDDSLERVGLLSLGTFGWEAQPGTHALVVRAGSTSSDVVTVVVEARPGAAAPTTRPTARPSATPSASPSPSATASPTRSAAPSATAGPTPSPTPSRTSSPTPKPVAPVIGTPSFTPETWYWDRRYSSDTACAANLPQQSQGSVQVSGATTVSIVVGGHAFAATRSGGTWIATVRSEDVPGTHTSRQVPVVITATGPGGSVSKDAGTVFIQSCEKD